jgi:hypothetical protein
VDRRRLQGLKAVGVFGRLGFGNRAADLLKRYERNRANPNEASRRKAAADSKPGHTSPCLPGYGVRAERGLLIDKIDYCNRSSVTKLRSTKLAP